MRVKIGEHTEDLLTGLGWLKWRMFQSDAWEKEGESFMQKLLKDSVFQDQQGFIPSDLFSRQNWETGERTSRCPLSGFLKGFLIAHPVEMCR